MKRKGWILGDREGGGEEPFVDMIINSVKLYMPRDVQ